MPERIYKTVIYLSSGYHIRALERWVSEPNLYRCHYSPLPVRLGFWVLPTYYEPEYYQKIASEPRYHHSRYLVLVKT